MAALWSIATTFTWLAVSYVTSQVIELDDGFLEKRNHESWLVEFYAPWCGHCKRLEPVYHQVSLALQNEKINVGRIDATRFHTAATEMGVRGYPTIVFVKGKQVYTHKGDRSKEGIVEFAKRANGPVVRTISNLGKFHEAKSEHSGGVFFMYVGDLDEKLDLLKTYSNLAEKHAVQGYFYKGTEKTIPSVYNLKSTPCLVVFKDDTFYEYQAPDSSSESSLEKWISSERFEGFPLVTGGSLNEMSDLDKFIVIFVIDVKDRKNNHRNERLKELARTLALKHRERYRDFQFVWMDDNESVSSILMSAVAMPAVLVLDPRTQYYYLPNISATDFTFNSMTVFLSSIANGEAKPYGGTGFFQRLKRVFYDLWMTIYGVYATSAWLALLVFGLPTAIISIVCYALCCMEPIDENELPEDEEEEDREEAAIQAGQNPSTEPVQKDNSEKKND